MADTFVDSPMSSEYTKMPSTKGGPGTYDGYDHGPFAEFKRTKSPNSVPEKIEDASVPSPSGESDQFA
jgi:hypothetical protein